MKPYVFAMFLVVEAVNCAVVYGDRSLLEGWQGWAMVAAPVLMALISLALPAGKAAPYPSPQEPEQPGEDGVATDAGEGEASELEMGEEEARPSRDHQPDGAGGAVQIMAVLQQEGRLIDFLMEDISPYSDEQVGAAAREVHEKCRRAVEEVFGLKPVLGAEEGARVEVDQDFDPSKIRLVGRLAGGPPFKGVLRHAGWRCTRIELPSGKGRGGIIAPAEVEV